MSDPKAAAVFFPRLLPLVEKVSQEIPDPEARSKAEHAYQTLKSRFETVQARCSVAYLVGYVSWCLCVSFCLKSTRSRRSSVASKRCRRVRQ